MRRDRPDVYCLPAPPIDLKGFAQRDLRFNQRDSATKSTPRVARGLTSRAGRGAALVAGRRTR